MFYTSVPTPRGEHKDGRGRWKGKGGGTGAWRAVARSDARRIASWHPLLRDGHRARARCSKTRPGRTADACVLRQVSRRTWDTDEYQRRVDERREEEERIEREVPRPAPTSPLGMSVCLPSRAAAAQARRSAGFNLAESCSIQFFAGLAARWLTVSGPRHRRRMQPCARMPAPSSSATRSTRTGAQLLRTSLSVRAARLRLSALGCRL